MADTKTLSLILEAPPVGEPVFTFVAWNPPIDTREVFPVTAQWPSVSKTAKVDDDIYIQYHVKNIGTGPGRWTITVKDVATGATLQTWYGDLDPGYSFKTVPGVGVFVGKMPAEDWDISVTVTP